jgi:hypothetical protein
MLLLAGFSDQIIEEPLDHFRIGRLKPLPSHRNTILTL